MIPFRDSVRSRQSPWVNWLLIATNTIMFLVELTMGSRVDAFLNTWGVVPADIIDLIGHGFVGDKMPLTTLFTAQFLHAGLLHLGGNMLFLWVFGDNVEDRLGHLPYLAFYLIGGAFANLIQVYTTTDSTIPLIGASGAVAVVLGSYLITYPRAWVSVLVPIFFLLLPLELPAIVVLGFWFISQLGSGLVTITEATQASGGVAWWAHIGGFLFGMGLTFIWPKPRGKTSSYMAPRAAETRGMPRVTAFLLRVLMVLGEGIRLLLIIRIIMRFFGLTALGSLGELIRLFYVTTSPLIKPFATMLPSIPLGPFLLDLPSLLALVAYHVLFTLAIWALHLLFRAGAKPQHYR